MNHSAIIPYIKIARIDHWTKHVFILPGIIISFFFTGEKATIDLFENIFYGFLSACFIASANYVINEWLDAETDKNHPIKKCRPAAQDQLNKTVVYIEYLFLLFIGLFLSYLVNIPFLIVILLFVASGIIYNVPPIRTKEKVFLDVISESINNPIRLMLGWTMVSSSTIPPLSLIAIFWFTGGFLMAVKRLSEYRLIKLKMSAKDAGLYRASFKKYSEVSLLISSFIYSMLSAFSIGILLLKYKEEYIICLPIFVILFSYYLYSGLKDESLTQTPEKLHHDKLLLIILSCLILSITLLSFINFDWLVPILNSKFIMIGIN